MAIVDRLRVVGSPETNKVMAGELSRLARRAASLRVPDPKKQGTGTLLYPFDPVLATVAVRFHRTATRVLWDLYESRADRLEPLYDELVEDVLADRREILGDGGSLSVKVKNVGGFPAGERQLVGTVKNALVDGLRQREVQVVVDADAPDLTFVVRMHDDVLSVSVDLAGGSMSQRGYRREHGAAPLREHLAAVLTMLARFDARKDVLVDPMCGAGTICIEAALMARGEPLSLTGATPILDRLAAFREVEVGNQALFGDTAPTIIGNDLDVAALMAARENATVAACASDITWRRGDFRDLDPVTIAAETGRDVRDGGLILANPPYGERIGDDVEALYKELGRWCREFRGWRAAFLVAHPGFEWAMNMRPRIKKPLNNGPLRAYFYLYDL